MGRETVTASRVGLAVVVSPPGAWRPDSAACAAASVREGCESIPTEWSRGLVLAREQIVRKQHPPPLEWAGALGCDLAVEENGYPLGSFLCEHTLSAARACVGHSFMDCWPIRAFGRLVGARWRLSHLMLSISSDLCCKARLVFCLCV